MNPPAGPRITDPAHLMAILPHFVSVFEDIRNISTFFGFIIYYYDIHPFSYENLR